MLYQHVLRPAIFRLTADDPEHAHEWVICLLAAAGHAPGAASLLAGGPPVRSRRLRQQLLGTTFPNPVGVAAGFDKNAVALRGLAALGFGFVEAGTVTHVPQPGNPRPRIVRLPEQQALINRMGFNNDGAAAVSRRLSRTGRLPVPLGISLGKSRVTPLDEAVEDYCASLRLLAPYADYIALNVSSPNTPGLRVLQEREHVDLLLDVLQRKSTALAEQHRRRRPPLLVKVAPDLSDAALDELVDVCAARGVDGLIAVNTTVERWNPTPGPSPRRRRGEGSLDIGTAVRLGTPLRAKGGEGPGEGFNLDGGLSGRPLHTRAVEVVRHIHQRTQGRLPIVGVGGIFTAADAYAMIRAGASLVQVYTGLIYEGPAIARRINQGLLRLMARDGVRSTDEVRGLRTED